MHLELSDIHKADTNQLGFFRFKKFDAHTYLITNDAWKFEFLCTADFKKFVVWDVKDLKDYDILLQKGFIKDEQHIEKMSWSVALKNHFVWLGPTLHMIVITLRCNHKCQYCHAAVAPMSATNMDMTRETAKKVVDTIFYTNAPALTIEFQGGEALVNYDVLQYIVEYANMKSQHLQKQVTFSLVSNLTLMTEEKLKWLLDHQVDICTSLDGNKVIHNGNRTWYDGDSFDTVTYWMQRVSEEKVKKNMGKIGALLTATKSTLPKYKEIIDTYVSLGLDGIFLRWLNPYGFAAADMEKLSYSDDDWIEFYKNSLDYIIEMNLKWTVFRENITSIYLMKIFNFKDPAFMDIRSPSGLAIGWVAYNYDGKVYASDESRMLGRMWIDDFLMTPLQETGKETYHAMLQSDTAKIAIQSSTLDGLPGYNDHVYKPYLGVDIIHNFKMSGSLYQPLVKDGKMKLQIAIIDYIFDKIRDPEVEKIFMSWIK
jgi:uncharacterized protein